MNSPRSAATDSASSDPPPRRRRFWLWAGLLFAAAFGLAVLVVDRRGARILAPRPTATDRTAAPDPDPPPSTLTLELRYDLSDVRRVLDSRIPSRFGDLEERRSHADRPRVSYAVAAERGPLELELRGDTAHLTTVVQYQGRIWFDSPLGGEVTASCGQAESAVEGPRATVRLSSPLEIQPDWRIRSSIRVEEVRPASAGDRDRCRVALGPLRMDVTDALLAAAEARVRDLATELDAVIGEIDLRSALEPHWARVQDPIPLGRGVWLQVAPESIRAGALQGRGTERPLLSARLAVVGRPRIVVGARPPPTRTPLPPLGEGPVPERFTALVDTRIDYRVASRLASDALEGREFTVGSRVLRIGEVEISAVGDGRLAVGLDVEGAVRGRVYLVGTPVLDSGTEVVTVPDLAFSVQTRNVLVRTAAWLIRGALPERVQQAVRWDASVAGARARSLVSDGLDRSLGEGVRLEGSLARIEIVGVDAAREGLVVRSRLDGALRMRVTSAVTELHMPDDGDAEQG